MNDTYKKILSDLKLQKSRALSGVRFGSWILCLESIEDAPVEVVFIGGAITDTEERKEGLMIRRTYKNLEEACNDFKSLGHFMYGMKGYVDNKLALRFESPAVNDRLSV